MEQEKKKCTSGLGITCHPGRKGGHLASRYEVRVRSKGHRESKRRTPKIYTMLYVNYILIKLGKKDIGALLRQHPEAKNGKI